MTHSSTVLLTDVVNGNGRIYPKEVIQKAVDAIQPKIKERAILGSVGFRDRLSSPSHVVTDMTLVRDTVYATIETLDNEEGKALERLIKEGVVVFRTGGYGSVNDKNEVMDDFEFVSLEAMPKSEASPLRSTTHKVNDE